MFPHISIHFAGFISLRTDLREPLCRNHKSRIPYRPFFVSARSCSEFENTCTEFDRGYRLPPNRLDSRKLVLNFYRQTPRSEAMLTRRLSVAHVVLVVL